METHQIVAIGLIVLGAMTPMRAADRTPLGEVRFLSSQSGEVVIPLFIEGGGPYRFILDTGSSHTAVSETLARALGAIPAAKTTLATSVGSIPALVVRLPDVVVGSARVESLLATSLPANVADMLGERIVGVLGQDFLSTFNYTLDYRASRLSWDDEDQTGIEKGVRLALEPSIGRFLVHLPQDAPCRCPLRLVPDSGANGVVLFAGTASDGLALDTSVTSMRVSTLVGEASARSVTIRALVVGPVSLWNLPAARLVRPDHTTGEGDGLLPLSLFARVSFRHQERYMVVESR